MAICGLNQNLLRYESKRVVNPSLEHRRRLPLVGILNKRLRSEAGLHLLEQILCLTQFEYLPISPVFFNCCALPKHWPPRSGKMVDPNILVQPRSGVRRLPGKGD